MRAHGHGVRHWRRAMPAAAAALAIWAGLGGTALLLADQRPAAAQSAEAVGRIAQAITVRIEGATQGSGVLVRREGNRYTVLTAWHVVADQKPGEELDIYAPDGNRYPVEQGNIKRLGEVDLAVLTFSSDRAYTIAITGEPRGLPLGSSLYVSGFPLGTSSVPLRLMRLLRGDLVGNGVVDASRSQYLLYSNPTLPGMSGGAVLNLRAELIGIHINAERADQISESTGKAVATGVNQGLAIGAYRKWVEATAVQPNPSPSPSALTRQAAGQEAIPEPLKGVSDAVAALRPPSAGDRIWVKVRKPISIEELATSLNQDETRLARLNAVNEDYQFKAGDWLVLPSQASRQVKQLDALDVTELRRAPPQPSTPEVAELARVRFGDTLLKIAQRYNLTIAELVMLNPTLRPPARLVVDTPLRLPRIAQSASSTTAQTFKILADVPYSIVDALKGDSSTAGRLRTSAVIRHDSFVRSASFGSSSRQIISASDDGQLRIWDVSTGSLVGSPLAGHSGSVLAVAISPDGERIVSGSTDRTLRLWSASTGQPIGGPLRGHSDLVWTVAFSPDGRRIVSGSFDNTLQLWDASTGEPIGSPLIGHTGWVRSVAFSPDGRLIVSGSGDGTLRLWNASTGEPIRSLFLEQGPSQEVWSSAFSPDGRLIASGSQDGTLRVWDAYTGQLAYSPLRGHKGAVLSVAFSPDGSIIASGSEDKTLRFWDASTGRPVGSPLKGHEDRVVSVLFSSDGRRIASGSWDKTLRFWDAGSAELGTNGASKDGVDRIIPKAVAAAPISGFTVPSTNLSLFFDCSKIGEVRLIEDTSQYIEGTRAASARRSRLVIPGLQLAFEGKADIFHGGNAHEFNGVRLEDWGARSSSGYSNAYFMTDVNLNAKGTAFEEASLLVLGSERFSCKERNRKPVPVSAAG